MLVYLCPSDKKYACSWEGQAEDILHHFELEHDDLLHFSDTFTVDMRISSENRLLLIDEEIYLAQLKCSEKTLEIRLRYLGPSYLAEKIYYNVILWMGNGSAPASAIQAEDGKFEVDLDQLKGDSALIRCTLNISKPYIDETDSQDCMEETLRETEESDVELRRKHFEAPLSRSNTINFLENRRRNISRCKSTLSLSAINETPSVIICTHCGISLFPPNQHHSCGQNHCIKCRQMCHSCMSHATLEMKLNMSLVPCRYQRFGCPMKVFSNDLKVHESSCVFCEYKCPMVDCTFEGQFRYMVKHLKLIHGSTKLLECFFVAFQTYPEAFLALEEKGIFYCRMCFSGGSFIFEAKFCGPKERKFFCELQFKEGKLKQPVLLQRNGDIYSATLSQQELKTRKLKAKHAILTITA